MVEAEPCHWLCETLYALGCHWPGQKLRALTLLQFFQLLEAERIDSDV